MGQHRDGAIPRAFLIAVRVTTGLLLAATAIAAAAAAATLLLGYRPITVLSDSMSPGIRAGDAVLGAAGDGRDAQIGDIVAFLPYPDDPTLLIHRVVDVRTDGTEVVQLTTRGDANGTDDAPIRPDQVRYTVPDLAIPAAGRLLTLPPAQTALFVAVTVGFLAWAHSTAGPVREREPAARAAGAADKEHEPA